MLGSGEELDADIIVTATGLNVRLFGGAGSSATGRRWCCRIIMAFKGMMLTGLPNMAFTIGYTNPSWTLKADLVSEFACRVINYMDANGYDTVEPQHPGDSVEERQLMEFTPGYILRALDHMPKGGRAARGGSSRTTCSTSGSSATARSTTRRCSSPNTMRRWGPRLDRRDGSVCGDDDNTVVVAVGDLARHEHNAAELDGHVA